MKNANINHHERFHSKRANISARYNDWKFVAISGYDIPMARPPSNAGANVHSITLNWRPSITNVDNSQITVSLFIPYDL